MTKLIAVIDGSVYSQSVCDHAAWASRTSGSEVAVVHVLGRRDVSSEPVNLSGSIGVGARSELLQELAELDANKARLALKRGRAILDDAKARLERDGAAAVSTRLRHGELVTTVAEFEDDAELLIIGKRGEAADFTSGHLGSNLERVVRATHKQVLVVARAYRPIQRALIAFDGGPSARKAVAAIASSPLFAGVAFHLLTVGAANSALQGSIATALQQLTDAGLTATSAVVAGQPEAEIASAVDQGGYDLLVMGAYGHSMIRNMIIGSTTTEMLRSCKISVLLFR
ncbi:MAG: universal stress protein [Pseudomonadales bacterium]